MARFDEAWLRDYEARSSRPSAPVAAKAYVEPTEYLFRLIAPLPLLNVWERYHWATRRGIKKNMAQEIAIELGGVLPSQPWSMAEVTIWRHSIRAPDSDNLIAKSLLDVLQPASKRHPYGLGVIAGDDPEHCKYSIHHVQEKKRDGQCTRVRVRKIAGAA